MCMCGQPVMNGQPGYSWDGKGAGIHPVNPPELADGDTLLYDEPGRCGGLDCHSYHFRLVQHSGRIELLVRHGGGDERFIVARFETDMPRLLEAMKANDRFWLLHMLYYMHGEAADQARSTENIRWSIAAVEKRIKIRRRRGVKTVSIAPRVHVVG